MEIYLLQFATFGTYIGCSTNSEQSYTIHLLHFVKNRHYNLKLQVAYNQGEIPDLVIAQRHIHTSTVSLTMRTIARQFPYILDEHLPISQYDEHKLSQSLLFNGIRQFEVINDPLQCIAKIYSDDLLVAVERVAPWIVSGKYICKNQHLHKVT